MGDWRDLHYALGAGGMALVAMRLMAIQQAEREARMSERDLSRWEDEGGSVGETPLMFQPETAFIPLVDGRGRHSVLEFRGLSPEVLAIIMAASQGRDVREAARRFLVDNMIA